MVATHLQITRGSGKGTMPEQQLNGTGINAGVEKMSRKTMAKSVDASAPLQIGLTPSPTIESVNPSIAEASQYGKGNR